MLFLFIPLHGSAVNGFPIGLSLEFEIETRSGGFNIYTNSYTKSYDFIQWTDTSQNTVELQIDTETFQVAFGYSSQELMNVRLCGLMFQIGLAVQ